MGDKCWTTKLTTYELSEQLMAMVILNLEHEASYDDAELLEVIEAFNDRLDPEVDRVRIATLNVYAVPHWNHVDIPGNMTDAHLTLIHDLLEDWQDDND